MVGFMWEPLIAAVKKEPETDLAASMLDSLAGGVCVGGGLGLCMYLVVGTWGVGSLLDELAVLRTARSLSLCGSEA